MISICIITKNEIEYLKKNLETLKNYNCEIVVVDTGSTDGSVEIAKEKADIFGQFEWCDDFARAKNFATSLATNNIIITLDTDEFIEEADLNTIEKTIADNPHLLGRIKRLNPHTFAGEEKTAVEYIRRGYDRRYYQYKGRIHEQLCPIGKFKISETKLPFIINHLGYFQSDENRKLKAKRNINLLLIEKENNPEDEYITYQLGKAYMYDDRFEEALSCFEENFTRELNPEMDWVLDMIINTGFLYLELGKKEEAMSLECLYSEFENCCDFHFMMGNIYMQNARFDEAVKSFLTATTLDEGQVEGNNSYNAFYNVGVIYECLGDKKAALDYYMKCGDFKKAVEGAKRCK